MTLQVPKCLIIERERSYVPCVVFVVVVVVVVFVVVVGGGGGGELVVVVVVVVLLRGCFRITEDGKHKQILLLHTRLNDLLEKNLRTIFDNIKEVPEASHGELESLVGQLIGRFTEEVDLALRQPKEREQRGFVAGLLQERDLQCHTPHLNTSDRPRITRLIGDTFRDWLDVSGVTLQWTLLYLGHFQLVQQHCQHEIDARLDGHAPGVKDRDLLTFTQAVLSEVIRLRPCRPLAAPVIAIRDTVLGGYDIPSDTRVVLNSWSLQHDHHQWDSPDDFHPHRFLDDDGDLLTPPYCSWMPSLTGSLWSSTEEELLKLQLLLMVSSLLHNFNISLSPASEGRLPDLTPHGDLWLRPHKFQVILEARPRERRRPQSDWRNATVDCGQSSVSPFLGVSSYARCNELRPQQTPRDRSGVSSLPPTQRPEHSSFRRRVDYDVTDCHGVTDHRDVIKRVKNSSESCIDRDAVSVNREDLKEGCVLDR
ncbi:steroid 17-alpha-hydroxylase/17,20 lyase-like [Littorina saxatilis]|uniref:steroid 17-alpha-hydroxylase/17,20 lyase-like n=1 Tax=Littorina saxatilis TaxID=31220 RepID=UPI0038B4C64D